MTEVGMAISGGLDFADRVDGSVGWPLPSVHARLVDPDTNEVIPPDECENHRGHGRPRIGEIHLRGPCVFAEYWGNPKATEEAFVTDASGARWFRTGDVATRLPVSSAGLGGSGEWAKGPLFFIQGRQSVDIIKTAGEKVSALEVERELLSLYVHIHIPSHLVIVIVLSCLRQKKLIKVKTSNLRSCCPPPPVRNLGSESRCCGCPDWENDCFGYTKGPQGSVGAV